MMRVGVTGAIGSGKSFVAELLNKRGFPVFNCDQEAKRIIVDNKEVRNQLMEVVGSRLYTSTKNPDGTTKWMLQKPVMAQFLFKTTKNNQLINQIVHPQVAEDFLKWSREKEQEGVRAAFMESAILIESGFNKYVEKVILVCANDEIRKKRVMNRDGLTPRQINERMKFQTPQCQLIAKADFLIHNNDDDDLDVQINQLIDFLLNR